MSLVAGVQLQHREDVMLAVLASENFSRLQRTSRMYCVWNEAFNLTRAPLCCSRNVTIQHGGTGERMESLIARLRETTKGCGTSDKASARASHKQFICIGRFQADRTARSCVQDGISKTIPIAVENDGRHHCAMSIT